MEDEDDGQALSKSAARELRIEEYLVLREAFFNEVKKRIKERYGIDVAVTLFNSDLLNQVHTWSERKVRWSWWSVWKHFWHKPARLEMAIHVDGSLRGLISGAPSRGKRHLSVYFLEGRSRAGDALKGRMLQILSECAVLWATALGCRYVRVVDPLDGLITSYEELGYRLVSKEGKKPIYYEIETERVTL